jgi:hypothetical protein
VNVNLVLLPGVGSAEAVTAIFRVRAHPFDNHDRDGIVDWLFYTK